MPKSVMVHQFSQVPSAEIPRSSFDRSHGVKTTFDSGYLVPIYCDEVLPGDTFNCRMTAFGRMATPIHPVMDNLFLETFFFFVPLRLMWSNFKRFMGEQDNPGDSIDFVTPKIAAHTPGAGELSDYLGLPTGSPVQPVAWWHRAYNLIYNEWFRDENLQDSVYRNVGAGPDPASNYVLLRRGKRHDYFTSALPWPQKGPTVNLPLGNQAPVIGIGTTNPAFGSTASVRESSGATRTYTNAQKGDVDNAFWYLEGNAATGAFPTIHADLSNATASTINELRQAFQIQKMQERDARGGTRYTEIVRSHFGVISPDARLQRPEFLGGGTSYININPVQQTSETQTGGNTPQGNLAAYGTVTAKGHGFTKSFTEHGVILGMVNVRADLTYAQGLNRMFSRETRYDHYFPALSHLGEQAVLNKEIYYQGTSADDQVFGYQERFAEYRYKPSQITGKFRPQVTGNLASWHLSQYYTTAPALNASFIEDKPPIDRVVAVPSEPEFLLDAHFSLRCARPMPVYSVPGLIDHF